jgi:hypothetical protein
MPDYMSIKRGYLQTQLGASPAGVQDPASLEIEWYRRYILNGTSIAANGVIQLGPTTFAGNTTYVGVVNVASLLSVSGLSTLSGNVTCGGFVNVASTLQVGGITQLTGNVTTSGYVNVGTTLQVAGVTTLNGGLAATGNASVVGGTFGVGVLPASQAGVFEVLANSPGGLYTTVTNQGAGYSRTYWRRNSTYLGSIGSDSSGVFGIAHSGQSTNDLIVSQTGGVSIGTTADPGAANLLVGGFVNVASTLQAGGLLTCLAGVNVIGGLSQHQAGLSTDFHNPGVGALYVAGNANVIGLFTQTGNAIFNGLVNFNSGVTATAYVVHNNTTDLNGNTTVSANATFSANVVMSQLKVTTLTGNTATGNVTTTGFISATQNISSGGDVSANNFNFGNSGVGAGQQAFGAANCPAVTPGAPFTWVTVKVGGTVMYMPVWK